MPPKPMDTKGSSTRVGSRPSRRRPPVPKFWGDVANSGTAPGVVKGSVEDIWSLDEMISIVMVSFGKVLVSILIVVTI